MKFAISMGFVLIFVYGSELFPTTVRSKCIGLAASIGRGTGTITTWLNSALLAVGINPVLFFGCLGFLMLIILRWLPETQGCKLEDEITTGESREKSEKSEEEKSINGEEGDTKSPIF